MCCLVKLFFSNFLGFFWNLPWGPLCLVVSELELSDQCHAVWGGCFFLRIVEVGCSHAGVLCWGVVWFFFEQLQQAENFCKKGETGSLKQNLTV